MGFSVMVAISVTNPENVNMNFRRVIAAAERVLVIVVRAMSKNGAAFSP